MTLPVGMAQNITQSLATTPTGGLLAVVQNKGNPGSNQALWASTDDGTTWHQS